MIWQQHNYFAKPYESTNSDIRAVGQAALGTVIALVKGSY